MVIITLVIYDNDVADMYPCKNWEFFEIIKKAGRVPSPVRYFKSYLSFSFLVLNSSVCLQHRVI